MNYTNGFDNDLVLPALQQRLGWVQPTVSGSPVINADNLTSLSGRCFQDFHSIVTIQNIKESQEDPNISDDDLNTLLVRLQQNAINRSLNEIFRVPQLIEQNYLFNRSGYSDIVEQTGNRAVGYVINTAPDQKISTQATFASLLFDGDCTINMYLFLDGVREPLQTMPVTVTAWANTIVPLDNVVLNYKAGGLYYLCYFESELPDGVHAIKQQVSGYSNNLCFSAWSFSAPLTTDGTYFAHNYRSYGSLPTALNLEVISFYDHTQKIIRNAQLFDEVQGLQMAVMVLEMINMSTRTNITQRQTQQQTSTLDRDLNQAYPTNEVPVTSGLKSRIFMEFKRLRQTFFPDAQPNYANRLQGNTYWDVNDPLSKIFIDASANPPTVTYP